MVRGGEINVMRDSCERRIHYRYKSLGHLKRWKGTAHVRAFPVTPVAAVVAILLLVFGFLYLEPIRTIRKLGTEATDRQIRLLCETDYQVLLDACRELAEDVGKGELKPGLYHARANPDPEVSRFPEVIVHLNCTSVEINADGRITIELAGGFDHFGVIAYPSDYMYDPHLSYGDRSLIPGLWYYDDEYAHNPEYDEKIDALIRERTRSHLVR